MLDLTCLRTWSFAESTQLHFTQQGLSNLHQQGRHGNWQTKDFVPESPQAAKI